MKTTLLKPTLLAIAIAIALGACSSMPNTTSLLDQTRSDYLAAQSNPKVTTYAPLEISQAGDALERANSAARQNDSSKEIDKLSYIAKQKIALAQEVAKQKSAEAEVASSAKMRDQMRLEQRTSEADAAKRSAERSNVLAQESQRNAAAAQRDASTAQRDAEAAQRDTVAAQLDSAAAQRGAAAAQMQTLEAQQRSAILEAQLADLTAKKTERGLVITLGDVLFGTDLARLNADGMRTAQRLADVLQQNPQRTVLIEGFTDSTGSTLHNQQLSERRASTVQSALQTLGIGGERIEVRGYGATFPVAANDTKENRQLNRRVEIVISDAGGKIPQR